MLFSDKITTALGKVLDIDRHANRVLPNKAGKGRHSGPQFRTDFDSQETSVQWQAVCQDCGTVGGSRTGSLPVGKPIVPGVCPSHVSGKPNMPHRAKWEQR
jgi:hypothetical protein